MAKKRETKKQTNPPTAHGFDTPSTATRPPRKEYLVGLWANLPQYVCNKCGWDTLDAGAMQEHLFWVHSVMVEMEGAGLTPSPTSPTPSPSPNSESTNLERGDDGEVFEVELVETGSAVDEQGVEHKTFTVKE